METNTMSAIRIADNVYAVGVTDPGLTMFDIVMETKYGTTYNAYLVRGEKIALIDTVKAEFTDEYLSNIEEIVPIKQIEYVIVNHTEPDHSGALPALLKRVPGVKIICSANAVPYVKNVINTEANITGVKDNHIIDLGGKTLTFKSMPYMHWPDTMMEYLTEDKILFSNDGFAAHVASDSIYADEATVDLDHEVYYYWDSIMRPFSGFIRRNLKKLDDIDIQILASSHGPIYRKDPRRYIDMYKKWAVDKTAERNNVAIFYASNYGNTQRLSEAMASELQGNGFTTDVAEVTSCTESEAKEIIESSKAVVIGTPTFNGDAVKPIWDLINLFSTVDRMGKKAAVFGSYAWGGEGVKLVAERLAGLKLKLFEEQFRARLIPSENEMTELYAYVSRLAEFFDGGKK